MSDIIDIAGDTELKYRDAAVYKSRGNVDLRGRDYCLSCGSFICRERKLVAPFALRCTDCQDYDDYRNKQFA